MRLHSDCRKSDNFKNGIVIVMVRLRLTKNAQYLILCMLKRDCKSGTREWFMIAVG